MGDEYLLIVRDYESDLDYLFPNEKLGIGDRFIFNQIIRESAKHYRESHPKKKATITIHQNIDILGKMERYGFKPRKPEPEGDRLIRALEALRD